MIEILDEGIKILYAIARLHEDASFDDDQKEAVRQIKRLASSGNSDAAIALRSSYACAGYAPISERSTFGVREIGKSD